jgi:hypothetical protein
MATRIVLARWRRLVHQKAHIFPLPFARIRINKKERFVSVLLSLLARKKRQIVCARKATATPTRPERWLLRAMRWAV